MKTPSDFVLWNNSTLQKLAAAQTNEIEALKEELRVALAAWRKEIIEGAKK